MTMSKETQENNPVVNSPAVNSPGVNVDVEREDFSQYLVSSGIHSTLVRILLDLYNESDKPNDPITYIQDKLGDERPQLGQLHAALDALNTARRLVERLRGQVAELELLEREINGTEDDICKSGLMESKDSDHDSAIYEKFI